MVRKSGKGRFAAIVAVAAIDCVIAAAVFPAISGAAVTVGSDLFSGGLGGQLSGGCPSCTIVQYTIAGRHVVAPFDGVVVRWRVIGQGTMKFRVVRADASGNWSSEGSSAAVTVGTDPLVAFPTRLQVHAGDYIGVDMASDAVLVSTFSCSCGGAPGVPSVPTPEIQEWTPSLQDGETRQPSFFRGNLEPRFNADLEPDGDHDGYGDETQDCSPTDAAVFGPCAPPPTPTPSQPAPSAISAPASIAPTPSAAIVHTTTKCVVPNLRRRTVRGARKVLARAHCRLGPIRRQRSRTTHVRHRRVMHQSPQPGRRLSRGGKVSVVLRK